MAEVAGIIGGKMEGVTVEVGGEEEGRQSQSGGAEGGQEPAMVHPCANLWLKVGKKQRW